MAFELEPRRMQLLLDAKNVLRSRFKDRSAQAKGKDHLDSFLGRTQSDEWYVS